ncbi:MAG TPA: hypothetical protein VGK19_17285 [Capsulimonadaceae bacterium]|jgi:hypothetical protein
MADTPLNLPPTADWERLPQTVEACCAAEGLTVTMKGSLVKHPGCIHWHYKRGRERGTLELTLVATTRRVWFTVQAGRTADWIAPAMERLAQRIVEAAGGAAS